MSTNLAHIRKWYSGKALKVLDEYVIPTIAVAEEQGYWPTGASRKIRAALNKQTVAIKWARANERGRGVSTINRRRDDDQGLLDDIADCRGTRHYQAKLRGWELMFAMEYGAYDRAPKLRDLADKLRPYAIGDAELVALDRAGEWVRDFIVVAELVERLDAGRPQPQYVFATVSPTVRANVSEKMGIDFASVRMPPIEWRKVQLPHAKTGKLIETWIAIIHWPDGTRHHVSRFTWGSKAGNSQCEACGHAIKSNSWVPLVADTASGPVSLWVGRDCAETLFGAKIVGDAKIERASQPAT